MRVDHAVPSLSHAQADMTCLVRVDLRAIQIMSGLMGKALPLHGRVNVHLQACQLQHEELLPGEAASPPQPALLGQPEALPCLQVGAGQSCAPLGYLLQDSHTSLSKSRTRNGDHHIGRKKVCSSDILFDFETT